MSTARVQSLCLNQGRKQGWSNLNLNGSGLSSSSGRQHRHICTRRLPGWYMDCQGKHGCTLIKFVESGK